jgi:hypothetical protein
MGSAFIGVDKSYTWAAGEDKREHARPKRSCDRKGKALEMAWRCFTFLLIFGFIFVTAAPEPVESRPRYGKSRSLKAGKKETSSRRSRRERGRPAPVAPPEVVYPIPENMPPLPDRRPASLPSRPSTPPPSRAATPPEEGPKSDVPLGPEAPPEAWPQSEIREAQAQCRQLLGDNRFDFQELEPIRKGVCGTPAPIRLKYINDVPRVEIRPPATMNCPLAAAMDRWMREVVQPRAKDLLHATVIRVYNLAAYDCRARYNNPLNRMSYHAFAAALDIAEFITAKGEHVNVLEHWNAGDERAQFLRDIHAGACKIFGTVLGPEANEAHRNHFHVDLAKRRHSAFCE